jgi:C-terminal binding-module, SLH-like, of glucodextranase
MPHTLTYVVRSVTAMTAAVILSAGPASTAPDVLFTLADPRQDDHGDGSLIYPLRHDIEAGELDLVSFAARNERDGTTFEATFAQRIRQPDKRVIDAGGGTLDSIAKLGFHNFNIDIYIDTDRREGSGRTALLPGRVAEALPDSAWERVICLTPRPFLAQGQLARIETRAAEQALRASAPRVDDAEVNVLSARIKAEVKARAFFPTRVSVVGASVRFFVPASFLGGPTRDTWGYIVAVSGAELEQKLDLGSIFGFPQTRAARLMNLPIAPGRPRESFGGGRADDPLQPPLVDVIVPAGTMQEVVLKDYDIQAKRPVRLAAVVPASR